MLRALAGFPPSLPLTHIIPITEAMIPTAEMINGNNAAVAALNVASPPALATATAANVTAEMTSAFRVLDNLPEKKCGMGAVVCMCPMPGMLRENVLQIPCWYI